MRQVLLTLLQEFLFPSQDVRPLNSLGVQLDEGVPGFPTAKDK
jgi:hypothetical protein